MIAIRITVSETLLGILGTVPKELLRDELADVLNYDVYEFAGFGICAIGLLSVLWKRVSDRVSVTEYRRFGPPRETSLIVNGDGYPASGGIETRGIGVRIQRE